MPECLLKVYLPFGPSNFTVQCLRSYRASYKAIWPCDPFQIQTRVWKGVEMSLTELGEAGSFTPACTLANLNALLHYLAGSLFLFPWATNQSSNLSQWCRRWHWIIRVLSLQNRKERARWLKITPLHLAIATPRHGMAAMSQSCGSSS